MFKANTFLAVRMWPPQVSQEPDLTLTTNGSVSPTMLQGDSATRGCVSSVYPLSVGIAKAKACFRAMATKQARSIGFWES